MSQENPFAKLVVDPTSKPDPNKISLQQLEKYNSYEMEKLGAVSRTLKKSAKYMAGVAGLCLVAAWWGEQKARNELFGHDSTILIIQIREEAILICLQFVIRNTTPTTESSSACSTSLKPKPEILQFIANNCWQIWVFNVRDTVPLMFPRSQLMKSISDHILPITYPYVIFKDNWV